MATLISVFGSALLLMFAACVDSDDVKFTAVRKQDNQERLDAREFAELTVSYTETRTIPRRVFVLNKKADVLELSEQFFSAGELASNEPRDWIADASLTFKPRQGAERIVHVNFGKKAWIDVKTGLEWPLPDKVEATLKQALIGAKELRQQR